MRRTPKEDSSGFAVDLVIFRGDVGNLFLHFGLFTIPSYSEYAGTFYFGSDRDSGLRWQQRGQRVSHGAVQRVTPA